MKSASETSSEEKLLELREQGKISEDEYEELLGTIRKPSAGSSGARTPAEPQFEAFRKRVLIGCFAISILGIVLGLILELPHVWVLGIIGIIVAPLKYHLINKRRQSGPGA